MSDRATVEKQLPAKTSSRKRIWRFLRPSWQFLRNHGRTIAYGYAGVLLVVTTVQALCIFFLWRPPQDWVSFGARVITSPAIAGIFAVVAASIGALQLSKQLAHTKEKTADEAWWQQFEWVTDRIISPSQKSEADSSRLPTSLAIDLMTSLSNVARAPFQKDAVGGIVEHYLKPFRNEKPEDADETEATSMPHDPGEAPPSEGTVMDAAAANSLRNLLTVLPESSPSTETARRVLASYESDTYTREIAKALRQHGFAVKTNVSIESTTGLLAEADIIASIGSKTIVIDVKRSAKRPSSLESAARSVRLIMQSVKATHGMIITPPTNVAKLVAPELALQGIHIVTWDPNNMRSFELKSQIMKILGNS